MARLPKDQVGTVHAHTAGPTVRVLGILAVKEEAVRLCSGSYDGVTVLLVLPMFQSFVAVNLNINVGCMIQHFYGGQCSHRELHKRTRDRGGAYLPAWC